MSDLKKEIEEIEAFMSSPSPLGKFARSEEPKYSVLKTGVETTGRCLEKAEYVYNMRKAQHFLAVAELKAFVNDEELPNDIVERIKEKIKVFTTEYIEGKWSC